MVALGRSSKGVGDKIYDIVWIFCASKLDST
jgi:hypothetical protein